MKLTEAVAIRLQKLLKQNNLTQYQLAKRGGIPRSTICVTVGAKQKTVKLDTVYQIADTLGMSIKDFFDDEIFNSLDD